MSHSVVARKLFDGWQITGITRFWSGAPGNVSSNGNPGTLGGGVRANYLGGQIYPSPQDRYHYYNPFAFGRPVEGTLGNVGRRSEEHTSELQSHLNLVCRLLLEKKKTHQTTD